MGWMLASGAASPSGLLAFAIVTLSTIFGRAIFARFGSRYRPSELPVAFWWAWRYDARRADRRARAFAGVCVLGLQMVIEGIRAAIEASSLS